jgi:hypothetical protein
MDVPYLPRTGSLQRDLGSGPDFLAPEGPSAGGVTATAQDPSGGSVTCTVPDPYSGLTATSDYPTGESVTIEIHPDGTYTILRDPYGR